MHRAHHYSPEEQKKLAAFQSISYLPLHTKIYREWLKTHWTNSEWENWVMMAIIGIFTGLAGAFLKNCIQVPLGEGTPSDSVLHTKALHQERRKQYCR
jgi:hypothetical protein